MQNDSGPVKQFGCSRGQAAGVGQQRCKNGSWETTFGEQCCVCPQGQVSHLVHQICEVFPANQFDGKGKFDVLINRYSRFSPAKW